MVKVYTYICPHVWHSTQKIINHSQSSEFLAMVALLCKATIVLLGAELSYKLTNSFSVAVMASAAIKIKILCREIIV